MTSLADGILNACEIARRDERKKVIDKACELITNWIFENAPHQVYDDFMSDIPELKKAIEK